MDTGLILSNLLNPPILFFFLGICAVLFKSDLEIPQPLPKFFSLYLLLAIGFKGGVELNKSGIDPSIAVTLLVAVLFACVIPIYAFFILRLRLDAANSAALAATYGSISAVTFITAAAFLEKLGIGFGGHLVAAMALMESPAIVIGVLFSKIFNKEESNGEFSWRELLHEAFFNPPVFLIVGSLIIGFLTGEAGAQRMKPFTGDIFQGMLAFFLLDMGLVAAKRLGSLKTAGVFLTAFAVIVPLINALLAIAAAKFLDLPRGDALMLTILCASASYIAVPAAIRISIPSANPSLYVPMALAITFPFNIIVGLPLYLFIIDFFWR
jgi:hypothetical protein